MVKCHVQKEVLPSFCWCRHKRIRQPLIQQHAAYKHVHMFMHTQAHPHPHPHPHPHAHTHTHTNKNKQTNTPSHTCIIIFIQEQLTHKHAYTCAYSKYIKTHSMKNIYKPMLKCRSTHRSTHQPGHE